MKFTLLALFTSLILIGCGSPDVEGPEISDKILTEAIDESKLQKRGKEGEQLLYAPNMQTSFTGWSKEVYNNGQVRKLFKVENGKLNGLYTQWYENGQKKSELNYKEGNKHGFGTGWFENGQKSWEGNYEDGKVFSASVWKPDGKECPATNLVNGNGVVVNYKDDGAEEYRATLKDGEVVED